MSNGITRKMAMEYCATEVGVNGERHNGFFAPERRVGANYYAGFVGFESNAKASPFLTIFAAFYCGNSCQIESTRKPYGLL